MDFKKILNQTKIAEKAVETMKQQTRDFEKMLEMTVKDAPDSDQKKIEEIRVLSKKAIQLAKEGKGDEAQKLIKQYQKDGR